MADPDYTESDPYGTPGSDAVTYTISKVSKGDLIDNDKWTEVLGKLNEARARVGAAAVADPGFTGSIQQSDINALREGAVLSTVSGLIRASHLNDVIDAIVASGATCVCNCNYCTCNCNYCTCNCNYACTCNCNY